MLAQTLEPVSAAAREPLHVKLDVPLPSRLWTAAPTVIFSAGWCFHREERIRELAFVLDGQRQAVMAHGMPRLDPLMELHPNLDVYAAPDDAASAEDPALRSYASGFWGLVRIPPRAPDAHAFRLELRAELADGRVAGAALGFIAAEGPPARPAEFRSLVMPTKVPLVAICMATHNPPADLFARQIDSIRSQTHENWICLISDDCSRPERFASLRRIVGDDPRFSVSRSTQRLNFYRNFERALAMVPEQAQYVALADQDDRWHTDKLSTLMRELGSATLVYSDARVVGDDGQVISPTYWNRRRNNHSDLLSLLVANSVTGAASLFRRELLDDALPFPPAQFAHYHDHWLALTARSVGEIAYVDRPLYDYVQHGTATLGHAEANRMPTLSERLRKRRANRRERVRMWRMHYFVDACRLLQLATILDMRGGTRIPDDRRRVLDRFIRTERSTLPLVELWARGVLELVGRPETLGAEWMLFRAFSWRRLLSASARQRPQRRFRLDAVPPPDLAPRPGQQAVQTTATRAIGAKIAPLELRADDAAPARLNVLIPTIDLAHFFGGYIAKFNLARRLAEHGARVRIVAVDPVPALPRNWRAQIESYEGLGGLFEEVEVAFGREGGALEVSRHDRFVASTWWTAHVAASAGAELDRAPFLYLIQEYEPFTFPMGTYAALAADSYRFPHYALFSSELLREYFRGHGIGVFAGHPGGDERSWSFQNAITDVAPPTPELLSERNPRRLLFYARPEPHAARNLFDLGLLALARAVEVGTFSNGWELNGIGTVELPRQLSLGGGVALNLLARADQSAYAALLREHDVGLALMYTPHPSLVPIEMASAGMLTVTNGFENKTAHAMSAISTNLLTFDASIEAIAQGLRTAVLAADQFERRVRGSDVRWSRDWRDSFDDALLQGLLAALMPPV